MTVVPLAPQWSGSGRVRSAANSAPPFRPSDPNRAAVTLLQQALLDAGFDIPDGATGNYGQETQAAVRDMQARAKFGVDGIAGREAVGGLDLMLRGWDPIAPDMLWGADYARQVLPVAVQKVNNAIAALTELQPLLSPSGDIGEADDVTLEALRTHFKVVPAGQDRAGFEAPLTANRIFFILGRYRSILKTLNTPSKLTSSIPENGLLTAAEAPFGGAIRFGPNFTDTDQTGPGLERIGTASAAAVVVHEATHVIDFNSGLDVIHISEFEPAYTTQIAINAAENPSAYATFAHHVTARQDNPGLRPGLGPNARGLEN